MENRRVAVSAEYGNFDEFDCIERSGSVDYR
jgi:hypothetical protein